MENNTTWIGIDNGVSGSIGIITSGGHTNFLKTPTFKHLKYTKKKAYVTRIDTVKLLSVLADAALQADMVYIYLERPLINPQRFTASASAMRAWEATLIVIEKLGLRYEIIDSKAWQKELLPKGLKGTPVLKEASKLKGKQLFPQFKEAFQKQKDADGMLIAEYCKIKNR